MISERLRATLFNAAEYRVVRLLVDKSLWFIKTPRLLWKAHGLLLPVLDTLAQPPRQTTRIRSRMDPFSDSFFLGCGNIVFVLWIIHYNWSIVYFWNTVLNQAGIVFLWTFPILWDTEVSRSVFQSSAFLPHINRLVNSLHTTLLIQLFHILLHFFQSLVLGKVGRPSLLPQTSLN